MNSSMTHTLTMRLGIVLVLVFLSVGSIASAQGEQAQKRTMLETRLQERIINLTANVTVRLLGVIDRFGNIISRLDTRIAKLKAQGVDTEKGEEKLSEAKRLLVETSITLENLQPVQSALTGERPQESFQEIKKDILAVREGLRTVRGLLIESVALLKEAVREAELERGVSEAVTESQENGSEQPETAPAE